MSHAVLERRWPLLARWLAAAPPARVERRAGPSPALAVDGVQLASCHDPRAEAELQARLVPAGAARATLYGLGQGELVRVLLARPGLERLRVVVLAPSATRVVLEHVACDWLADERLEFVHPHAEAELAPPFAAAPPDLRLAGGEGARVRDLVVLELATPYVARARRQDAPERMARMLATEREFGADLPVQVLFGTRAGAELAVAAAGPTLAEGYAELCARAHALVAVDSALKPLLAAGIVPAWVVTQDAHAEGMRRVFDVPRVDLARTALVYFPETPRAVLAAWPGPRFAARGASELERGLPDPRGCARLFASGSVLHPAVDLAVRLGAARVVLHGADFALCGGASHVAGSAWQFDWARTGASAWVLDAAGARVPSLPNLVGYLRDLERYLEGRPEVEFVSRSARGAAIRGAPHRPPTADQEAARVA